MTDPTQPGPDELAVKERLITLVDGPAAAPAAPTIPPQPTARPRDWLDDILDGNAAAPKPKSVPKQRTAPEQEEPASETGEDEEPEDEELGRPPAWDPTAIADRIVHAYRRRPVTERLKDAAQVVVRSRAQWGQLFFTASGVWVAWRVGFTPWLVHFTADAPTGIRVFFLGAGWLINRRLDAMPLPIAWIGRAIYTATVVNLVLHP